MKAKGKVLSQMQPNNFLHADFSDQPQQLQQKVGVRVEKRFFTSRHEDIDKQDDVSACLSIEKELPELSIRHKPSHSFDQNLAIRNLMNENKLKEEALLKATKMITLLKEENAQLNARIQQLQVALISKDSVIGTLENQLRLNTSDDKNMSKDVLTERNRHSLHIDSCKSHRKTPREERVKEEKIKSKTQLFFDFTHSKQKQSGIKKSQNTIFLTENPTFKEIRDINMSKKLTPYTSKNVLKHNTETVENSAPFSLTDQIALLMLQEQVQSNRFLMQELKQLVSVENEDLMAFESEFQKIEREFTEEEQDLDISNVYFKSVTKNRADSQMASTQEQSRSSMIEDYQRLIIQYREYSAFLKSYLCESLNFIHSMNYHLPEKPLNFNFSSLLKKIAKDIAKITGDESRSLWLENKELKSIIEQLIKNIEISRKKQISVRSWNQLQLPLTSFQ